MTTYKDIFGNDLKKVICDKCKKDITGRTHFNGKYGLLCLDCAVKKGVLK